MARYTLTGPERQIVTSWLFEQDGYLDAAVSQGAVSARQALAADPNLDVTEWIRNNIRGVDTDPDNWSQCGMVWWIRRTSDLNLNVTPGNRPPETAAWVAYLNVWNDSLVQNPGDTTPVVVTAENGTLSTIPANAHRVQQRNMIAKVLGVLT